MAASPTLLELGKMPESDLVFVEFVGFRQHAHRSFMGACCLLLIPALCTYHACGKLLISWCDV